MTSFVRFFMYILAALCFIYCVIVGNVHSGSKFYMIWGALGILFVLLGVSIRYNLWSLLPKWSKITICVVFVAALLLFSFLLIKIFSKYSSKPQKNVDYLLILGAQVKESGPSVVLSYRLETALEYLQENEKTLCIVSGGQGSNEPCSEAEAMADYLISHGISADRIILEDKSTDTSENIRFSRKLIPEGASVAVCTNNFHICRALYLAKRYEIKDVQGLAAKSTLLYMPNNVLREVIGLLKDFLIRPEL